MTNPKKTYWYSFCEGGERIEFKPFRTDAEIARELRSTFRWSRYKSINPYKPRGSRNFTYCPVIVKGRMLKVFAVHIPSIGTWDSEVREFRYEKEN